MQINRIEFQAVGPFPGRHVIDVDALGGNGLFLLDGPTGSGKTTLIDVLVFALFGQPAGGEQSSPKRLRSDHADAGTESYVDLVVTLPAGTYRIRRTPDYERPRKRGDGTTKQPHTAKLWRLSAADLDALARGEDPTGEVVATQVGEASAEIQRIVGLNRAQFTQTVVLPQGQFAEFLHARPDDRRAILQQIFGTDLYERIQEYLRELAARRGGELRDSEGRLAFLAETLAEAVGEPVAVGDAADQAEADPVEPALVRVRRGEPESLPLLAEHAASLVDGARDRANRAARLRDEAHAAQDAARIEHDAQKSLAAALDQRARLLTERTALEAGAHQVAADARTLDLAQRAATAVSPLRTLEDAVGRVSETAARLTTAHEAARGALAAEDEPPAPLSPASLPTPGSAELRVVADRLRHATARLAAERGQLTALVALEKGLPRRAADLEQRRITLAEQEQAATAAAAALEERPAARAEITAALDAAREVAATRAPALTEERAAAERRAAADRAVTAEAAHARAASVLERAGTAATTAVAAEKHLRDLRIAGYAGEVAATLTHGAKCPVCGSTSHPEPAAPSADQPTDADIEAAEAARVAAEEALRVSAAAVEAATTELNQWRDRAGGLDVAAATEAHTLAAAGLERATRAESQATALEARREEFDRTTQAHTASLASARAELADARARLEAATTDLAADTAEVADARGDAASVTARERALGDRATALAALAAAMDTADVAAERRATQEAEFARVLAESGLEDADAVRAAHLPAPRVAELRAALEKHRERTQRVADALARPEIAELTGTETADVAAARAALDAASAAAQSATEAAATAADRAERIRTAAAGVERQAAAHVAASRDAAHVVRLANLATGGDRSLNRTRLSTFVVLRRFEDVLIAANTRLRSMSSGRYELRRTDAEAGQRSRLTGLGLEVVDHHTSRPREPRTLSGGETFYVSLCLALGMVDIVRAEADGVDLGTLLIDEGFGTLDAETLDTVMRELTNLSDAGRTVGVVSHVAELKQAIPERIEVRRLQGRPGSTLSVTWMGG